MTTSENSCRCGDSACNVGSEQPPRRSRFGPWRAAVLSLVILLILVHMGHFLIAGWTLTVFDPAELMSFLEMGLINVGVVFTVVLIIVSLLFGRFFCGWACHIMAFEDTTAWLLRKIGITVKPFRSRLLWIAPFIVMIYMYVWPQVVRLWKGEGFPAIYTEWTTTAVWAANPGWIVSVLTLLTCSILIVYILGSRGFCAYACPYGAGFSLLQRVAPWRVRLTGDCHECGHCTAACPSDIRVHEEIREHGQVVSGSCVRGLTCVGVCPNDAITLSAGVPNVLGRSSSPAVPRERVSYDYSWGEELLLALAFCGSLFALRSHAKGGLYDQVPFLMALGCAAISAVMAVKLLRLLYRRDEGVQNLRLKVAGRMKAAGWGYAVCAAAVVIFMVHSGMWQYHRLQGERHFAAVPWDAVETFDSEAIAEDVESGIAHFEFCDRWGLVPTSLVNLKLAGLYTWAGRPEDAERQYARAMELAPESAEARYHFAGLRLEQRRFAEAEGLLREAVALRPDFAEAHLRLSETLYGLGAGEEAAEAFAEAARFSPDDPAFRFKLGLVLMTRGDMPGATVEMQTVVDLDPNHAGAHGNLGLLLMGQGRVTEALEQYQAAVQAAPDSPMVRYNYGKALAGVNRLPEALTQFEQAIAALPDFAEALHDCGSVLFAMGRVEEAAERFREALNINAEAPHTHNALGFALTTLGQREEAIDHFRQAVRIYPDFAEAHFHLSVALLRENDREAAQESLAQAHRIEPMYPGSLTELTARLSGE